jgi:hypothetical protein
LEKKDDVLLASSNPDFSECFQLVVMKMGTCILLWLMLPFWFRLVKTERKEKVTATWLTYTKTVSN